MDVVDEQASAISIKATESGNLYYNYAAIVAPMLAFVTDNSPYVLTFNDEANPTEVTLTSQKDQSKWFRLKR